MGSLDAVHTPHARLRLAALLLGATVAAVACGGGGGGGGDDDTTMPVEPTADSSAETAGATTSTLPPCSAAHHLVAFDVFGTLSLSDDDAANWLQDAANEPEPRPGAAAITAAYHSLGYEIWYVTTLPVGLSIGATPFDDAMNGWFQRHGYPTGPSTSIYTVASSGDAVLSIVDALVDFTFESENASTDAAYTDNEDKAYALVTGGIPVDRLFTLGSGAASHGSTALPADDMVAHLPAVQALDQVCESG
jgi:hypothetical protein